MILIILPLILSCLKKYKELYIQKCNIWNNKYILYNKYNMYSLCIFNVYIKSVYFF